MRVEKQAAVSLIYDNRWEMFYDDGIEFPGTKA